MLKKNQLEKNQADSFSEDFKTKFSQPLFSPPKKKQKCLSLQ